MLKNESRTIFPTITESSFDAVSEIPLTFLDTFLIIPESFS